MKIYILKNGNLIQKSSDSLLLPIDVKASDRESLVNWDFPLPNDYSHFIKAPHVRNGFDNSCSETASEVILRFWGVSNWDQYKIHQKGYLTFEGDIAEGDRGILHFFEKENFVNQNNDQIQFEVSQITNGTKRQLKNYIKKNIPVIIRIFTDDNRINRHTQVVIGYNKKGFFVNDNDQFDPSNPHWIFVPFGKRYMQFDWGWSKNMYVIQPIEPLKNKE